MVTNLLGDMLSLSIDTEFFYTCKMENKLSKKDNPCFQVHLAFISSSLSLWVEGGRTEKGDNGDLFLEVKIAL